LLSNESLNAVSSCIASCADPAEAKANPSKAAIAKEHGTEGTRIVARKSVQGISALME
jgi:hypothetical protein